MSQGHGSQQAEHAAGAGSSKRYRNFYSALQLAAQSSASKWTYEDFEECFPTYCKEYPVKAQTLRTQMAKNILEVTKTLHDDILEAHHAPEGTDILHEVVIEARGKRQAGEDEDTPDAYSADIEPRAAVHARTVPILETERERLLAEIEKVHNENALLANELRACRKQKQEYDQKTVQKLDVLDQLVATAETLPVEKMASYSTLAEEMFGSRA
ncbi:hypothetical protein M422DRAFT_219900 [Sphaerobolus stellatus SS14]|nr:hypothetical protein M422DRAFT_219900 [Sphaerobolus stellatus SS14]